MSTILKVLAAIALALFIVISLMHIGEHLSGHEAHAAELPDNEILGTPNNDFTDGKHKAQAPCDNPLPCVGDLIGTHKPDLIRGLEGQDFLRGRDGADVLLGGPEMDQLYGGEGEDLLKGGDGHDHMWGNEGDDFIDASDGDDEAHHIEFVDGDSVDGNSGIEDYCVMDEDPNEGIGVLHCETLVLVAVPGLQGPTPIYRTHQEFARGLPAEDRLPGPGTYLNP